MSSFPISFGLRAFQFGSEVRARDSREIVAENSSRELLAVLAAEHIHLAEAARQLALLVLANLLVDGVEYPLEINPCLRVNLQSES